MANSLLLLNILNDMALSFVDYAICYSNMLSLENATSAKTPPSSLLTMARVTKYNHILTVDDGDGHGLAVHSP